MKILSVDLGTRNLAWCVLEREKKQEWPPDSVKIHAWKLVDITEESAKPIENVSDIDVASCVPLLVATLKKYKDELICVEHAFLETQPIGRPGGASNIRTKVLSHIFQAFLLEHNIPVTFVSPKLKTKHSGADLTEYASRKKAAIKLTGECLEKIAGEWNDFWKQKKGKKDDLADAFLQGVLATFPKEPKVPKVPKEPKEPKESKDPKEKKKSPAHKKQKIPVPLL